MALHLLYRPHDGERREDGRHACLVDAADESTARTLANAPRGWSHAELAATASMPNGLTVLWMEGDAISMTGIDRGGNRV